MNRQLLLSIIVIIESGQAWCGGLPLQRLGQEDEEFKASLLHSKISCQKKKGSWGVAQVVRAPAY
jgi:hypothetical protein